MPSFLFKMKRRQSDGALKQPQPVNVDVEPLPRPPSKFRSLMGSGLFTRSTNDLRRTSKLQSLSNLLQPTQHGGRSRAATTTTVKIVTEEEDPSLARHVAEMPRDKEASVRRTSGESSSVSGHSDRGFQSARLPNNNRMSRTPLPPQQDLLPPRSEPEETAAVAEVEAPLPSPRPNRSIGTTLEEEQHDSSPDTESSTTDSPMSPAFFTPPQRISEEQLATPIDLPQDSELSGEPSVPDYEHTEGPEAPVQRRESAMSTLTSEGGARSPRKMSLVLHSAPMPLPIAHLPTMTEPSSSTGHNTPWGDLAKNGGPKSNSARGGGPAGNFPWVAPVVPTARGATEGGEDLSEDELHNVTKRMPVMLRVPSRKPTAEEDEEDGGGAGDGDSDSEEAHQLSTQTQQSPTPQPKAKGVLGSALLTTPGHDNGESSGAQSLASSTQSALGTFDTRPPARHISPLASSSAIQSLQREERRAATPSNDSVNDDDDSDNDSNEMGTAGSSIDIVTPLARPNATRISPAIDSLRPPLFSHASRSMINLPSTSSPSSTLPGPSLAPVKESRPSMSGTSFSSSPEPTSPSSPLKKRRLSFSDANPLPPKYEALESFPGPSPKPRDEEGRERLPGYWCGVHIEGTLSRKMEFMQPGLQAKDRAWKKYYFVLHGTALFVYKFDPTKVPLRANEPYLACDEKEIHKFLHVHPAPDRRFLASVPVSAQSTPRTPATRAEKQARRNTVSLEGALSLRGSPIGAITGHRRGTVGSQTPPMRATTPTTSTFAGSSSSSTLAGPSGLSMSTGPSGLSMSVPPSAGDTRDAKNPDLFTKASRRKSMMAAAPVASSTASAPLASHMPFAHNTMIHQYTLQSGESGLAADYKKRLHCVRIRAEGQQFLLQTETARQCVQWIEAFQAATNVALDLDVRPMPVQQTLPRRRRRPGARRNTPATTSATADPDAPATGESSNAAFEDTPEGNIAAVEAAERAERDRERMLDEDQAANDGQFHT